MSDPILQDTAVDLATRELRHRTRNNLHMVAALLRAQARDATTPEASRALKSAAERVVAFELINTCLEESSCHSASPRSLLMSLARGMEIAMIAERPIRLKIDACEIQLNSRVGTVLGLVANELITNALKYAFPDDQEGTVLVRCRLERHSLRLSVEDDGIGIFKRSTSGRGLQLVGLMVAQLGGTFCAKPTSGTGWEVSLPGNCDA